MFITITTNRIQNSLVLLSEKTALCFLFVVKPSLTRHLEAPDFLSIPVMSHRWNHMVYNLLELTSFT